MSTLTPVKLPVNVLHRAVVLVVDEASVDSLCPRRQSSPLSLDVGEAAVEHSASCRRPRCRRSFCGLAVSASSLPGSRRW